VVVLAWGSDFR